MTTSLMTRMLGETTVIKHPSHPSKALLLGILSSVLLTACQGNDPSQTPVIEQIEEEILITAHQDLVSAGLGLAGLRGPKPQAMDALSPTPEELRAMAIHTHFTGLSAVNTADGLGGFVETDLPVVAGVEVMTWRAVADTGHRARALLQIPDQFNQDAPCLVVAPASGSRGVYGAAPLVSPWALPKGCAVVYSDKGAGTDYFDLASQTGVTLNGQRTGMGEAPLGFVPQTMDEPSTAVATAHAHSQINVEAHWGEITLDATQWALDYLSNEYPIENKDTIRVIAAGLSNGGHAVLKALEADQAGLIDAVVSVMPNITPPNTPHLYEYASMAALYQPCLLGDAGFAAELPFANPLLIGFGPMRCQSLAEAGLLDEATPQAALEALTAFGFDQDGLMFSASTVVLDVWRTILVNYASAYLKTPFDQMPCGYRFDASTASEAQKAAWWATGSGSPPGDGITLVDTQMATHPTDPHFAGLQCLYELMNHEALQASIAQTKASARWPHQIPVFVVHGQVDGLIPAAFSSRPYVAQAISNGMQVDYQEIEGAQHFDAFLNALVADPRWKPILPHGWAALDQAWDALDAANQ